MFDLIWVGCLISTGLLFVGLVKFFKSFFIYVPSGQCAVVSRRGDFSQIGEGIHFIRFPFEQLRWYTWTYREEDDAGRISRVVSSDFRIPLGNMQMDPPANDSTTATGLTVSVNGTLHYQIIDPILAVTKTSNLLGFLDTCVAAATTATLVQYDHDKIKSHHDEIAFRICSAITKNLEGYGVVCSKFIIQSIRMNRTIQEAMEKQITFERDVALQRAQREQNFNLEQQQAQFTHEREIEAEQRRLLQAKTKAESELENLRMDNEKEMARIKLENDQRIQQQEFSKRLELDAVAIAARRQEIESISQLARAEANLKIAELEKQQLLLSQEASLNPERQRYDMRSQFYIALCNAGFTPADVIQLENGVETAQAFANSAGKADKWIMSPEHYRQMVQSFWLPTYSSSSE
ncbi:MAG: SPFH domain-containing protein [archaeon]|nr:SPFH domain-containing protein [archaeon]